MKKLHKYRKNVNAKQVRNNRDATYYEIDRIAHKRERERERERERKKGLLNFLGFIYIWVFVFHCKFCSHIRVVYLVIT
ncbi:hypothetical protein ACOSQ3_008133 [Xanthoceras sorbifolium]